MAIKRIFNWTLALVTISTVAVCMLQCFGNNVGNQSNLNKYDVIIVLGNPATESCQPSLIMSQRVEKGVELYNQSLSRKIIFSGGAAMNSCVESYVMRDIAISMGVPDTCIFVENQSVNTYQNAFFSVEKMKELGYKSAAIVTSKFHEERTHFIFSNYNIDCKVFPCENPPKGFKTFLWEVRERIILSYHFVFGYSPSFGL